jgi:hypothetical protein
MTKTEYSRDAARRGRNVRTRSIVLRDAVSLATIQRSRIAAAITDPDFVAIAIFSAIGLLVTINLMLHGFDFGLT